MKDLKNDERSKVKETTKDTKKTKKEEKACTG